MQNSLTLSKKKRALHLPVTKILPFLLPIILILFWQVSSTLGWLSSSVLPSPWAVFQDGIKLTQSGELPKNLSISLYRATVGLLIGGGIGFILGFINGMSKTSRLLFDSSIQMFRNSPH